MGPIGRLRDAGYQPAAGYHPAPLGSRAAAKERDCESRAAHGAAPQEE